MPKLIIMKGLPASGKSDKAKELLAQGNTVRLNKDILRTMLHCDKYSGRNEGMTQDAQKTLAISFLFDNKNVIIDDTNLNPKTLAGWVEVAKGLDAKIEYHDLTDVPVEVCIERDKVREKKVGQHVIQKMAMQYLGYLKGEKIIICDLDGTLCDIDHRLHYTKTLPKDWKSFFAEIPNDSIRGEVAVQLADSLIDGCKIIFVSARPETYRAETEKWLAYYNCDYTALIMREANDKRPDTEVKSDIYDKYLKDMNIIKVFDDRPSIVRMWIEKGLDVEDVGKGIEF